MEHENLKAGIYAIINKKLNTVYVGETEVCFLIRWIEHVLRIPKYMDFRDRIFLYLDEDTKYIVLKELDPTQFSRKEFYKYENEAISFYKEKGWVVVSKHNYSPNMHEETFELSDNSATRYKRVISHMIKVLGLINTKENNVSRLYGGLYKKINDHFNTVVQERSGKNILSTLKKEELEFMMLDVFPRYYVKSLTLYRKEYKKRNRQLSLF